VIIRALLAAKLWRRDGSLYRQLHGRHRWWRQNQSNRVQARLQ